MLLAGNIYVLYVLIQAARFPNQLRFTSSSYKPRGQNRRCLKSRAFPLMPGFISSYKASIKNGRRRKREIIKLVLFWSHLFALHTRPLLSGIRVLQGKYRAHKYIWYIHHCIGKPQAIPRKPICTASTTLSTPLKLSPVPNQYIYKPHRQAHRHLATPPLSRKQSKFMNSIVCMYVGRYTIPSLLLTRDELLVSTFENS